jgi:hypothetical protein
VSGVTDKTIKLALVGFNITGLATNQSLGLMPLGQQKSIFARLINSINKAGGLDCRQIVPQYFVADPGDPSTLQQTCLDITQSHVFATVDAGAFGQDAPILSCFASHHTPYVGPYLLPNSEMQQYYPYLFDLNSYDTVYQDTIGALAERGWFKPANGFTKLGLMYHSCYPELHTEVLHWLAQAGVKSSQIVQQSLGCPTTFAAPSALEEAILKFKQAHVSNVIPINMVGDLATYTRIAGAQNFKPIYGFPDDSLIALSYGTQAPLYSNIANSLAITASRAGEEATPSLAAAPTPGTQKCSAIAGVNIYKLPAAAGNECDDVWLLQAAVDHAPTLSQSSLAEGLRAAHAVEFSYPEGPNDFRAGARVTYGGQYWRVAQFRTSCKVHPGGCWQIIDPTFRPSVP